MKSQGQMARTLVAPQTILSVLIVLVLSSEVRAQWVQRTLELSHGWNSVFLDIDPQPASADQVFAANGIEAVWMRASDALQELPDCPNPNDPDADCYSSIDTQWRVWVPQSNPHNVINSLSSITGGNVYLIKCRGHVTLNVIGMPNAESTTWKAGRNLVGFHVVAATGNQPTFTEFLSPSGVHSNDSVLKMSRGQWLAVDPTTAKIQPNRAYWVKASQASDYSGPISIDAQSQVGLDYALSMTEHQLTVTNLSPTSSNIQINVVPSLPVPDRVYDSPAVAGGVPLKWFDYAPTAESESAMQWHDLQSLTREFAAKGETGSSRNLRLAVRRYGLGEATRNENGGGSQYQSMLKIQDGKGFERMLPVAAQAGMSGQGLWVGTVTANKVNWATAPTAGGSDHLTPRPTSSEFSFRVILHNDGTGGITAISDVTLMVKVAESTNEADFALVTPAANPLDVAQLVNSSIIDGEPWSRRISTAAYAFPDPSTGKETDLPMTGMFADGQSLTITAGEVILPFNHRLNPFHHRYHPDHDCKDSDGVLLDGNDDMIPDGGSECFDVRREFSFTFGTDDGSPDWGTKYFSGTYQESISGLINYESDGDDDPIEIEGTFEIYHVSNVADLNDFDL